MRTPDPDPAPASRRLSPELRYTLWFFGGFCAVAVALIGTRAGVVVALLWALACFIAGAAAGFLFGVPKVLQTPPAADGEGEAAVAYRQQVNTNLTEISDWLTKIIVGLGLINLKEIPGQLAAAARVLATGIAPRDPAGAMAFAYGVITTFGVAGFLFGYLCTRLFLAGAFSRADLESSGARDAAERDARLDELSVRLSTVAARSAGAVPESSPPSAPAPAPAPGPEPGGPESPPAPGPDVPADGTEVTRSPGDRPDAAPRNPPPPSTFVGHTETALAELRQMARDYLQFDDPDKGVRIRAKDDMAGRMAVFARGSGLSRDAIERDVLEGPGKAVADGLILVLATLAIDAPEPGDVRRLLDTAPLATRWHVQYRVVTALTAHAARLGPAERDEVLRILDRYEVGADGALRANLARARLLLRPPARK